MKNKASWPEKLFMVGGILLLSLLPGLAQAHAILVRSIPEANAELRQAPQTLDLWFSEPLEPDFNRVRLLTPLGEELPVGPISLDPADPAHLTVTLEALEPGIYLVAWQNLSQADGHDWSGSFPFTILNPDGSKPSATAKTVAGEAGSTLPTLAETLIRWLALVAALLFWGGPFFQQWVVNDTLAPGQTTRSRELVLATVALAAVVLSLSGWLQLALQALDLGGLGRLPGLLATRAGGLMLARQGLALVGLLVALARPRYPWTALLMLGAPLLLTFSIGSHASAAPGSGWAVLGDYLHLLAAATWVGGLILLPALVWRLRRTGSPLPASHLLLLFRRFSGLAGLSVFGLVVTGLFSSLVELPDLASLWNSDYGRVLLLKLGLVGLALGAAFLNHRLLHYQTPLPESRSGWQQFNRQVLLEMVLALGVMLAVAILVQTTPSRAVTAAIEAYQPSRFEQVVKADDLTLHLQIYPTQAGPNSFWVHLYHDDGSAIGEVQQVRLFFKYQDETLGQTTAELNESSPAIFTTEGAYLSQGGSWLLSIYVRRRGLDDILAEISLEVPYPPGSIARTNAWGNPVPDLSPWLLIAGGAITLGMVIWLGRRLRARRVGPADPLRA